MVAFFGGLIIASGGLDLSRMGFAQSRPEASTTAPLVEASNAFVSIANHVTPAVVSIQVESRPAAGATQRRRQLPQGMQIPPGMEELFDQFGGQGGPPQVENGTGSGFIVSKDGYILTNNHVVTLNDRTTIADRVTVQMLDNRVFKARVIGNDPTTDVAVIKIEGNNFPTLPLGNDVNSRVGEWVLAIGNPLGFDFTVTAGIISAKGRSLDGLLNRRGSTNNYSITDLIQTDAAINPGNSGGPLLNLRGEVVGVNAQISSESGGNDGVGFAIPSDTVSSIVSQIVSDGAVEHAYLGVGVQTIGEAVASKLGVPAGVALTEVRDGTPAAEAGLRGSTGTRTVDGREYPSGGDVVTEVDGEPVGSAEDLQRAIGAKQPGESIRLTLTRQRESRTATVKLESRPS